MEAQKIDRLSLLPRELLDYIFELGFTAYRPPTVPPSKHLLPSHQRALYRDIRIENIKRFLHLVSTLESDANNGSYVKTVTWNRYHEMWKLKAEDLARFLRQVPNVVEMNFGRYSYATSPLLSADPVLGVVHRSLTRCCFSGSDMSSDVVKWIKQQPNLRRIQLGSGTLDGDDEEEEDPSGRNGSTTALQVKEVELASSGLYASFRSEDVARVYRFFPSAQIVSVCLTRWPGWYTHDILTRFLEAISPTVRNLEFRRTEYLKFHVDHLLPRFDHLCHLHLNPGSYSEHLPRHLASVKTLTSLSLYFFDLLPSSSQLIPTLSLLPNLRLFTLDYYAGHASVAFDMKYVESRFANESTLEDPEIESIRDSYNLDNMASEEQEWYLPFHLEDPQEILDVVDWEKEVRTLGFEVGSNIEQVIRTLRRHIVEYNNRGIAKVYFDGETEILQYARELAEWFNFELPPLEIDLDDPNLSNSDKLEWFEVDLTESVRVGGEACIGLGLRYKQGVETEEHEEVEELSQGSEEEQEGE